MFIKKVAGLATALSLALFPVLSPAYADTVPGKSQLFLVNGMDDNYVLTDLSMSPSGDAQFMDNANNNPLIVNTDNTVSVPSHNSAYIISFTPPSNMSAQITFKARSVKTGKAVCDFSTVISADPYSFASQIWFQASGTALPDLASGSEFQGNCGVFNSSDWSPVVSNPIFTIFHK